MARLPPVPLKAKGAERVRGKLGEAIASRVVFDPDHVSKDSRP